MEVQIVVNVHALPQEGEESLNRAELFSTCVNRQLLPVVHSLDVVLVSCASIDLEHDRAGIRDPSVVVCGRDPKQ